MNDRAEDVLVVLVRGLIHGVETGQVYIGLGADGHAAPHGNFLAWFSLLFGFVRC